jgi:hypothetical protein
MIFILRSEKAPARVVRETDEHGTSRTFWIWRDGGWVVATRSAEGQIGEASSRSLEVEIEPGENVCIVRVAHPPPMGLETMPAPPPTIEESPAHVISAVVPVAPKIGDLEVIGVHADPELKTGA